MSNRHFLVIVDGTKEMEVALNYACNRAKKTDGNLILASFIKPIDVLTTKSVVDIMKNEAREEAETVIQKASAYVKEETGLTPIIHIREGEIIEALMQLIEEEEDISVLVLAASTEEQKGPGPIISSIISNNYNRIKIPVMIVPGNLTKEHINQIG
tara:strand:+ start:766 stop:1233 length:468 start_codon:yes stop_codon:yes gene_type:complete